MQFEKLIHGKLIKRYKRFLADVILDNGEEITAHVPNSGAMTSCIEENCDVWLTFHDNPKRKLKYTLELTKMGENLICTNTGVANKIAIEAIENKVIKELQGYSSLKPEQKYGQNSRIDILLENENQKCYVEVKSVSLRIDDYLAFPDAVTSRGTKHLNELAQMAKDGHRAVMLYVIQRDDDLPFRLANEIDKKYCEAFKEVTKNGVEVLVYQSCINLEEISIKKASIIASFWYNCKKNYIGTRLNLKQISIAIYATYLTNKYGFKLKKVTTSKDKKALRIEYSETLLSKLNISVEVLNKEKLPKDGNYLLMSNHRSIIDPLIVELALKDSKIHGFWVSKKELFNS